MKNNELKNLMIFELKSFIGRTFLRNRMKIKYYPSPLLLDIGSGSNITEGWVHFDFFNIRNPKNKNNRKNYYHIETDLRYPLNCESNIADGIFTSHFIEHLKYDDAIALLKELYRVSKPLAWLRIVVPDLELVIQYYMGENKLFKFETGCEAISSLTQKWGHQSVWDKQLLKKVLKKIGYTNINVVEYGKGGRDLRLIKEEEVRKFESLVIEAQKPR
jgi:predicted SAM-dependent methyltransferase